MKKEYFVLLIAGAVIALDQLVKFFVAKMQLYASIPVIPNILHFTYSQNTGAGFGILKGNNLLLIWLTIVIIGGIFYYLSKIPKKEIVPKLGFSFVLGGAIGNLIDRIAFGHVIDFIDFRIWPTFNIADSFISIGAVLLIIYYWKK